MPCHLFIPCTCLLFIFWFWLTFGYQVLFSLQPGSGLTLCTCFPTRKSCFFSHQTSHTLLCTVRVGARLLDFLHVSHTTNTEWKCQQRLPEENLVLLSSSSELMIWQLWEICTFHQLHQDFRQLCQEDCFITILNFICKLSVSGCIYISILVQSDFAVLK